MWLAFARSSPEPRHAVHPPRHISRTRRFIAHRVRPGWERGPRTIMSSWPELEITWVACLLVSILQFDTTHVAFNAALPQHTILEIAVTAQQRCVGGYRGCWEVLK